MTIQCVGVDTLLINGADIQVWAAITSAEGLLTNPPQRADIIEQDWTAGAIYQAGPKKTWQFEVPIIMRSSQQDVALGQLRALQAYVGTKVTLTRRLVVNGAVVNETCQAVMINSPQVVWDFSRRAQMRAVLLFQGLTPWVPA
jgi:hypothetical protein